MPACFASSMARSKCCRASSVSPSPSRHSARLPWSWLIEAVEFSCSLICEGLLVVAERLAEVTEQQVDATDVAERVADAARKVDAAIELEHPGVLLQRDVVVAQFVVDQAQVIEARAFELPVAERRGRRCLRP